MGEEAVFATLDNLKIMINLSYGVRRDKVTASVLTFYGRKSTHWRHLKLKHVRS